ncbi:PhzF family phenazine biosynthesis protein [Streptomyces boluensis]|uniref:PhzF family phenazine biosynthesis isomerase n=1 Tax=Streptomyces boluensis TaxID=1775135 RepID=A0A964URI8_9ACTN|nr:PhzF family phenazine biosynthesis protein [Streptomyces boluensis]NBE52753.1 PhzF family phenazine biosynthesis isomerase [Streptomyces boluensis]
MEYEFVLADVFTEQPFGGNQLAVFPDARGLSGTTMQALAKEFNFSETAFACPLADPDSYRLRIFTPHLELPFAGHPTIGSASVLAAGGHGRLRAEERRMTFEEGIGPVTVDVRGTFSRLAVPAPYEAPSHRPPVETVAQALSLTGEDVLECWYGGAGLPFCYVQLASADAVDRAVLDKAVWAAGLADGYSPHLYVFAGEFRSSSSTLYARAFVPAVGVDEDSATGSAGAGLIGSLTRRSALSDGDHMLRIRQGSRMGRPSLIEAGARTEGGQLVALTVGGFTTVVGRGTITVPHSDDHAGPFPASAAA